MLTYTQISSMDLMKLQQLFHTHTVYVQIYV